MSHVLESMHVHTGHELRPQNPSSSWCPGRGASQELRHHQCAGRSALQVTPGSGLGSTGQDDVVGARQLRLLHHADHALHEARHDSSADAAGHSVPLLRTAQHGRCQPCRPVPARARVCPPAVSSQHGGDRPAWLHDREQHCAAGRSGYVHSPAAPCRSGRVQSQCSHTRCSADLSLAKARLGTPGS